MQLKPRKRRELVFMKCQGQRLDEMATLADSEVEELVEERTRELTNASARVRRAIKSEKEKRIALAWKSYMEEMDRTREYHQQYGDPRFGELVRKYRRLPVKV